MIVNSRLRAWLFTSAVIILLTSSLVAAASENEKRVVVDRKATEDVIAKQLLKHTPVGTSVTEVMKFVRTELEYSQRTIPKYDPRNGALFWRIGRGGTQVGAGSITVSLGAYRKKAWSPFSPATVVSAGWAFDRKGRLIDIIVNKVDDGL